MPVKYTENRLSPCTSPLVRTKTCSCEEDPYVARTQSCELGRCSPLLCFLLLPYTIHTAEDLSVAPTVYTIHPPRACHGKRFLFVSFFLEQ